MNYFKISIALVVGLLVALSHGEIFAQSQYQVQNAIISAGGGDVSGGGLAVSSTIGQPVAGTTSGGGFIIGSGFWQMPGILLATSTEHADPEVPLKFSLEQNYPNPFNPVTIIEFALPMAGDVELTVYNILGQRVATLVNDHKQAGHHKVTFDAGNLASGVYFYRIRAGEFTDTRKLTLIK